MWGKALWMIANLTNASLPTSLAIIWLALRSSALIHAFPPRISILIQPFIMSKVSSSCLYRFGALPMQQGALGPERDQFLPHPNLYYCWQTKASAVSHSRAIPFGLSAVMTAFISMGIEFNECDLSFLLNGFLSFSLISIGNHNNCDQSLLEKWPKSVSQSVNKGMDSAFQCCAVLCSAVQCRPVLAIRW